MSFFHLFGFVIDSFLTTVAKWSLGEKQQWITHEMKSGNIHSVTGNHCAHASRRFFAVGGVAEKKGIYEQTVPAHIYLSETGVDGSKFLYFL